MLGIKLPQIDPILSITLMFVLTQIIGIWAGMILISSANVDANVQELQTSVVPTGEADDPLNAAFFLAYVVGGAVFALFLIRFFKHKMTFRFLEFFVLSGSVSVLFFAFLYAMTNGDFLLAIGAGGAIAFVFSIAKFFIGELKNTAAILSSAGVGALFGFSMGFWPALLFILGLSLYDYIAVFRTQHMLTLAQNLGDKSLSFTITAQSAPQQPNFENPFFSEAAAAAGASVHGGKNADLHQAKPAPHAMNAIPAHSLHSTRAGAHAIHAAAQIPHAAQAPSSRPIERLDLGSGDLAVPTMLSVAAYNVAGMAGSIAVALGASISLYVMLKFVVKNRVALPALPPICMGALAFLLAVKLLGLG